MAGIIATVSVFAIAQGLTYPLLSFLLQRQGVSPALIGTSAAMTPLGFIISAPLIPALSRRLGAATVAIICAIVSALLLALIGWSQDVWAWMPLRFLLGFFANPLYVISETWLITITPGERRGRIMGIYTSIVSGGFAIGPVTLGIVGTEGWPPFLVGVSAFILCGLTVLAVIPRLPRMAHEGEATSVAAFFKIAPLLLFAVFAVAAFEQSFLAMFAVYGSAHGNAESKIAALIACFIIGNVALQVPLGRLAERIGSSRVMILCACLSLLGCILLPLWFASWLIWPMIFVWGSVLFGIYTMSLIQLGERFSGHRLIAGNAAFALVWGIGGIIGSPVTGLMMQWMGHQGLPVALGLLCASLAVFLAVGGKKAVA